MVVIRTNNKENKPGLIRRFRNLVLQNSPESISSATQPDENNDAVDLKDSHPTQVKKTIENCRFAYKNDPMIGGLILNNAFTANHKFQITTDRPDLNRMKEAMEHINNKVIEWNLDEIITQTLIKQMRDGKCFIQKVIDGGTIQLNPLAYDGTNYDFKIITDPVTGKIMGYVQKHPASFDPKGWENKEWDELSAEADEENTATFQAEEMIYPRLIVEDGDGESLVMRLLDVVYDKWTLQGFKIGVAHKTGNFAAITVGTEKVDNKKAQQSFIDKLLDTFKNPVKKSAGVIPYGVNVEQLGNNNLPDLPSYLEDIYKEIYLGLQSPYGLFDAKGSTYASLKAATDDTTGFGVFMEFLRDNIKTTFEKGLINHELELNFSDCMNHIFISYGVDVDNNKLLTLNDLLEIEQSGLSPGEFLANRTNPIATDTKKQDDDGESDSDKSSEDNDNIPIKDSGDGKAEVSA